MSKSLNDTIIRAIQDKLCLKFTYNGHERIVEPHALGESWQGNTVLRCWQVAGGSDSNKPVGWHLFKLNSIEGEVKTVQQIAELPRKGYKMGDSAMKEIIFELKEGNRKNIKANIIGSLFIC